MILKIGSKGENVKLLQRFLKLKDDGDFGPKTEIAVKKWQKTNKLVADGIVGPITWSLMGLASTDLSESIEFTNELIINKSYLKPSEYVEGPIKPEYVFIHHTAGWHNPYNVISAWDRDNRGRIATEFVLGGQSVLGNDNKYDGEIVQAFPEGNWASHLGATGSSHMHKNSVGIEVCNFGYLVNGKTYTKHVADESQIVTLKKPFRNFKTWHRYSENQISQLKDLILFIGNRDSIDIREGLPKLIKEKGEKAFDFSNEAFKGNVKGLLTHTNVRKDKFDMFPQQELIDMLLSL